MIRRKHGLAVGLAFVSMSAGLVFAQGMQNDQPDNDQASSSTTQRGKSYEMMGGSQGGMGPGMMGGGQGGMGSGMMMGGGQGGMGSGMMMGGGQGGMSPGMMSGNMPCPMMDGTHLLMLQQLESEQQSELRELMQSHRPAQFERLGQMMNLHDDLVVLMHSERPSPEEVKEQHARMSELQGEMLAEHVRLQNAIKEAMSDEQSGEPDQNSQPSQNSSQ
ncbi:MAG TPA: hypothetical protein VLO12_01615 [Halomonas sp.]|nr:hypothetical protein [Halomonas sp.]